MTRDRRVDDGVATVRVTGEIDSLGSDDADTDTTLTVEAGVPTDRGTARRIGDGIRTTTDEEGRFDLELPATGPDTRLVLTVRADGTRLGRTTLAWPSDDTRVRIPIEHGNRPDSRLRLPTAATAALGFLAGCADAIFGDGAEETTPTRTTTPFEVGAPTETEGTTPTDAGSTPTPTGTETAEPTRTDAGGTPTSTSMSTETAEPTPRRTDTPFPDGDDDADGSRVGGGGGGGGGSGARQPTSTPTSTSTPTETPTSTPTPTGTSEPTEAPTGTPTATPDDGGDAPTDPAIRELAPPDPDLTATGSVASRWAFLYTGDDPVQRDVDPADIDEDRVSRFTGRVFDRSGAPLSKVTVRIDGRPELGWTTTRADGRYDMVVNGGGRLTLEFAKQGYLPAQRSVTIAWDRETTIEDVALIQPDGTGTDVVMDSDAAQIVEGAEIEDEDGTRRAVVIVPPETTAMRTDDGTAAQSLTVRTAEYTVGERGPAAMPGDLPPSVAYTYATEFFAELADGSGSGAGGAGQQAFIGAGSEGDVQFDRPVAFYLENFLGFPVGTAVPAGSYDRDVAQWVPSNDGRVVEILRIDSGTAVLDLDGNGTAAGPAALTELGIGDAERERLAELYDPGQELWRTPLPHFTPWDCNWPVVVPPSDAEYPPSVEPRNVEDPDPCNE